VNVEQRQGAADPQTKPHDLGCESACFRQLASTTTIAIYNYYSARKLILIYRPTEGRRLSWPRHCRKGAHSPCQRLCGLIAYGIETNGSNFEYPPLKGMTFQGHDFVTRKPISRVTQHRWQRRSKSHNVIDSNCHINRILVAAWSLRDRLQKIDYLRSARVLRGRFITSSTEDFENATMSAISWKEVYRVRQ